MGEKKKIANFYYENFIKYSDLLRLIIPKDEGVVPHIYPIVIFSEDKLKQILKLSKLILFNMEDIISLVIG